MKNVIIEQLHYGHLGVEKTRWRARDTVYWININQDIEKAIKSCVTCQEYARSQCKEPLLPHEIPTRPWEVVGMDLFQLLNAEWLIIADYFSKYIIVRKMPRPCTSSSVVSCAKQVFAELGIPSKVMTDNGPHFDSFQFKELAREWGFQLTTSSPRYPRSNGFIESQVKVVKATIGKAVESKQDPQLALLALRATPIDNQLPSPRELLLGRRLTTQLPSKIFNSRCDRELINERLKKKQSTMKTYHDQTAHELPPLQIGQSVRFQKETNGHWQPAKIIDIAQQPRSYILTTPNGQNLRRNRIHIRDVPGIVRHVQFMNQDTTTDNHSDQESPSNIMNRHAESSECEVPVTPDREVRHGNASPFVTRSGRTVVRRKRYED
ncbi:Uncharacterised protein g678 [Pycnogonum litorale]